jgi:hypothetical protein
MITQLTPEQEAQMAPWADKWIKIGLSTEPADFDKAAKAALRGYQLCNLPTPKHVLFAPSPYAATLLGILTVKGEDPAKMKKLTNAEMRAKMTTSEFLDGVNNDGVSSLWASWAAYVSYFRDVVGWQDESLESFRVYEDLVLSCGWSWMHEEVLVIGDRPKIVHLDGQGRLHNPDGPSLEYRDGWKMYHSHGVPLPDDIMEDRSLLTAERINKETNAEVRRCLMEMFGYSKYIAEVGEVVDQVGPDHKIVGLRNAKLLYREIPDDEPLVYLDMENSSDEYDGSRKRYLLAVDPTAYDGRAAKECLAAMASTWRDSKGELIFDSPEDYSPEVES